MYSSASQDTDYPESQSQPHLQCLDKQLLRAAKQSTLYAYATRNKRVIVPEAEYQDSEGRTESIFVEDHSSASEAESETDIDQQPLVPRPSKRQRITPPSVTPPLTPPLTSDDTDEQPEQPNLYRRGPRKVAPSRGDSTELWSHARARRTSEPERERKKKIWYCYYKSRDCPYNYSTTNYDNIRSHLARYHSWKSSSFPRIISAAVPRASRLLNDIDRAALNRRLIDYITSSNIPFRTASNIKLHALLDEVFPGVSELLIKTHYSVAKHVKKEHDFYMDQLKALLATSQSVIHFTCDAWTANYGSHELLSITARFVAPDGKLSKALLALHELPAGHAGKQCAPLFFQTIVDYNIQQKIGYITSDNATCNDTMMQHLATLFRERLSVEWDPIQHRTRCFGHQINLASQAFMSASSEQAIAAVIAESQEPSEAIAKIGQGTGIADHEAVDYLRKFFEWVMKSARRRREFKACAGLAPMLNNTTRWNSWLAMIKRGLQCRTTIRSIQSANENMEQTTLKHRHWQFLETLVEFMEPLQQVTKLCEGDDATLDQVLMSMDFLRKHYDQSIVRHASDPVLTAAIRTSRFALDKWQAINDYTPAYTAALLLHPTYREAYITTHWPQSWRAPAIAAARALWSASYKDKIKPLQTGSSEEGANKLAMWQASIWHTTSVQVTEEFVHFTKSPPVLTKDPIKWWLEPTQQQNYPNLSHMAIDVLSINPMSAESERVFSGCRRTLSWDRAQLSATNLGYIECLKNWQKNLCFESVELPVDEAEEEPIQEEEGQGHSDDDEGGIGIIPLMT